MIHVYISLSFSLPTLQLLNTEFTKLKLMKIQVSDKHWLAFDVKVVNKFKTNDEGQSSSANYVIYLNHITQTKLKTWTKVELNFLDLCLLIVMSRDVTTINL